jgi:hypothetical protein
MVADRVLVQRARRVLLTLALSVLFGAAIYLGSSSMASPARHNTVAASGGLRFVDGTGKSLSGATVRILCYANAGAAQPLADLQTTTDISGHPTSAVPAACNDVAALQLLHTQPSGKPNHGPAYWVYATRWAPFAPVLLPSTGDVTITLANPLVLFNVVASLEWQPATNSPFVNNLMQGLNSASAYLYSLSEGQMAIGPVTIQTGGTGWESADLRFRAANDYRPSARIGGIVSATTPYTTTALTNTVYVPGEILLGRYWDGEGASDPITGNWMQPDAYRTLMHEWGHYALFLYDEYQITGPMGSTETYCTCSDLPSVGKVPGACGGVSPAMAASAMAFHYTASKLWLNGTPAVCMGSEQWLVHGEQDWQTLGKWSRIQGLPVEWVHVPAALASGPILGVASNLFGRSPGYLSYIPGVMGGSVPQSQLYIEPNITVTVGAVLTPVELSQLVPQVYVSMPLQAGNGRIVYQGTTDGSRQLPNQLGNMTLFGVPSGLGHARIFIDRYTSSAGVGGRFIYPVLGVVDPPLANGQTLLALPDTWRSSLELGYGLTGRLFKTLTVTLTSLDPLLIPPLAQLCLPDAASGCAVDPLWHQTMQHTGAITWTATFTGLAGAELPHYGIVDVQASGGRELMRWYLAYGGVGPAHIDGNAPLADGLVSLDAVQAVPGVRNLVAIMPAANYKALHARLPSGVHGIVGSPLDVRVMLPDAPPPYVALNTSAANPSSARPGAVQPDFTASPAEGVAPLTVHFTNLSTGAYVRSVWTFGDGGSSTDQHPVYTYTTPGIYTVTLTVYDQAGSPSILTRPNYIRIRHPGTIVVTFFYNPATLRRITIGPSQLVILHFDARANAWEVVQSTFNPNGRSTALNWLSTPPTDRDGIFALGWTGAP